MRAENLDSKVYNGDIGYVKDVAPDDGELTAAFGERLVTMASANSHPGAVMPQPSRKAVG